MEGAQTNQWLEQPAMQEEEHPQRMPYAKPRLQFLGDVRKMTAGGSPGAGDSGPTQLVAEPPG